ncbi:MAG: hypothetical protein ABIY37_00780 [Devosia sp.]
MLLIRVLGILAMCSAASWSLMLSIEDVATSKLLITAARIESSGFFEELEASGLVADRALDTCRLPIVRAGVTTLLAQAEATKSVNDKSVWLTATQRAAEMIDHAVRCSPADGEMWGRAAQISQANSDWTKMLARLSLSQRLAPADDAVLRTRIDAWASLPSFLATRADESLRSDVRIVLEHGRLELVRLLLASAPSWMLPALREEVAGLSADRRGLALQLLPILTGITGVA